MARKRLKKFVPGIVSDTNLSAWEMKEPLPALHNEWDWRFQESDHVGVTYITAQTRCQCYSCNPSKRAKFLWS